jgi:glycosyltransferase involved in cell wall biosynthesis
MVIAVDTRLVLGKNGNDYDEFIRDVLRRWISGDKKNQFYLVSDRVQERFIHSVNVHYLHIKPAATSFLLLNYWYDLKLPSALKKIKADVLLSPHSFISLRTKLPQCLMVPDLDYLDKTKCLKKSDRFFLKRYMPKFLKKAAHVFTLSETVKDQIKEVYKVADEKMTVLPLNTTDTFKLMSWEEKDAVKEQYTEGKEYFIHSSIIATKQELVDLLKAFSFFKKRQQSGMKLVLAGNILPEQKLIDELLASYKYRNDVLVIKEEKEKVMAAAYAMVYPSIYKSYGLPVVQALSCDVPVVAVNDALTQELTSGNAFFYEGGDVKDLAEQMMYVYKDENERARLIQAGREIKNRYNWQQAIEQLSGAVTAAPGK